MHTNHRRGIRKRREKKGWPYPYSLRWMRYNKAHRRRQEDRNLLHHERYDELRTHYPKDNLWDWW